MVELTHEIKLEILRFIEQLRQGYNIETEKVKDHNALIEFVPNGKGEYHPIESRMSFHPITWAVFCSNRMFACWLAEIVSSFETGNLHTEIKFQQYIEELIEFSFVVEFDLDRRVPVSQELADVLGIEPDPYFLPFVTALYSEYQGDWRKLIAFLAGYIS